MDTPQNVSDVRRFLGMVNQLGKFVPHLAEKSKLIRDLLSTKNEFLWGATQQDAFEKLKKELTSTPVLAHYDPAEKINPVGRCFILWTRRSTSGLVLANR